MKWTKESALIELNVLIQEIDKLMGERAFSAAHTSWIVKVSTFFDEVFGGDSVFFGTFTKLRWRRVGSFTVGGPEDPVGSFNPQKAVEKEHHRAYLEQLDTARGLLMASRDRLEKHSLEDVYEGKNTGPEASSLLKVMNLVEFKLRKVIRNKPEKGKEIQDAFESLLIGADITYSREADSIEYSTKKYIPDFSIPRSDLVVEIKLCNRDSREKEMIAEINDDILAYKTKYGNIIFVVYDTGLIRDMDRFMGNFEENEGVIVRVVKH